MEYCNKWCYTSTLLSEYYFKRVLHPFRNFSWSSHFPFLKLSLSLGTIASIEAFYSEAGCIFLKECPTVFKECIALFAMEHCKIVVLHYNSFLNIVYTVSNEYCIDSENFLIEAILCPFKGTSHVSLHFVRNIRNTAPMKESCKVC